MKSPTLSIVIPVYNASSVVTTIATSILNQEFTNYELLLVDDGSTDDTINVLRGIKKNNPNVVVVSKKNGGPSSARNLGLERSRGKYVMFFDSDDDISPQTLSRMVGEIERQQSDITVGGWRIDLRTKQRLVVGYKQVSPERTSINGSNTALKKFILQSIGNDGQLYNLWNKIFRRDIIEKHRIRFREDVHFGEDLIFSFEYFSHINKLSLIPDVVYHYQANSATSLFSKSALVPEYRQVNLDELEKFVGDTTDVELRDLTYWIKWRWLLSYYLVIARSSLSRTEKLHLIKQAPLENMRIASSPRVIGLRKWMIELVVSLVRRSPYLALPFAYSINRLKELVIKAKSIVY